MSLRTLGDVVKRTGAPLTVLEHASVLELSHVFADGHVDAVAVLSINVSGLAGIVTTKDVAKCIARAENLTSVRVSQIMSAHPVTLPPNETPANALSLMREGGFRHIPVVRPHDGAILGIVDVLSLAYDAITRLQMTYSMVPTRRGFDFMRAARDTIEKPTLRPIVESSPFGTLKQSHTVLDACQLLVRKHIAAIVVVDDHGVLDGIFTCRDIVTRVVLKRCDPAATRLEDVMTRSPDCASPHFTILESLQRMQACGFKHLPVVEDHTRVVIGLVDVLHLASHAIAGLQTTSSNQNKAPGNAQRPWAARGLTSLFGMLFSKNYGTQELEADAVPIPQQHVSRAMYSEGRYPALGGGADKPVVQQSRLGVSDAPLASFKFRDKSNEFRRIKVPITTDSGAFDQFVVDVRRRYAGSTSVGPIKIKYIDEDGDEVLISNSEDLAACLGDFADTRNKTVTLRVYETDRAVSSSQTHSPVSSRTGSPIARSIPSVKSGSPPASESDVPRKDNEANTAPLLTALPSSQRDNQAVADRSTPVVGAPRPQTEEQVPRGLPRAISQRAVQTPSMAKAAAAHQQLMDGKFGEAISLYSSALKLDDRNSRARGGRAAARLFNGDSSGAEEDYRAAIRLLEAGHGGEVGDVTFQNCVIGLIEALIDQRRYEEAGRMAERIEAGWENSGAVDAFKDELESAGKAAAEAWQSGDVGDAMNCFSNALRVEAVYLELAAGVSAQVGLRLGRAKCYIAFDDFDMALEDYDAAAKIDVENVEALKGCGKCLAELDQVDRALECYEAAQKIDGSDRQVAKEVEALRSVVKGSLGGKKETIMKLGALLGAMNYDGKK